MSVFRPPRTTTKWARATAGLRRPAGGSWEIRHPKIYLDGSHDDGMDDAELEAALIREVDQELDGTPVVKQLAAHLAVEVILWLNGNAEILISFILMIGCVKAGSGRRC